MGMHANSRGRSQTICAVHVRTRSAPRLLRIQNVLARHRQASSAPECAAAAQDILTSLRHQMPCQWLIEGGEEFDFELARLVDGFEAIHPFAYPADPPDLALDDLNELLARLLDWADDLNIKLAA